MIKGGLGNDDRRRRRSFLYAPRARGRADRDRIIPWRTLDLRSRRTPRPCARTPQPHGDNRRVLHRRLGRRSNHHGPGSSAWFERGFVTYTYISKREMLGVNGRDAGAHGAVSEAVVREMAAGALEESHAQLAVAVSGIAGPTGGTPEKPVGDGVPCLGA